MDARFRFLLILLAALAFCPTACSAPSALGPARSGDLVALRTALDRDIESGRLTRSSLAKIAQTLASRELREAQGPQAIQRLAQGRICAEHLEGALRARAEGADAAAPEAAMILLTIKRGEPEAWRKRAADSDAAWRAVGVRTLTTLETGKQRRAALLDADENVRAAAANASEDANDVVDLPVLLDVARHDPNAAVRVQAVRVAAQLGGAETVLALRDTWETGDSSMRQAIAAAYAWPGLLENGGLRQLIWIAETDTAAPAVVAAGILLRLGPNTRGTGMSMLMKMVRTGTSKDRAWALAMAPLEDPAVRDAVKKAAAERDPEIKVAALSRLARDAAERESALKELGSWAASREPAAVKAKVTLARAGDVRVTALLMRDGQSPSPAVRARAAALFVELGDLARAARFLADADAAVRMRTACAILEAPPRR